MALISVSQLAAIQKIGLAGMTTRVVIKRRTVTSSDYGDDVVTFATVATTTGWLFSHPTPVQVQDVADVITTNTYRLYLPVDTDIRPGDRVEVGAESYIVSDTTAESTWKALLACSLRKRE